MYRPQKLESGCPDWFEEILNELQRDHRAGLDHERHYKSVAFLQPYDAEGDKLAALLAACFKRGFKVHLKGSSYYSPGSTFSIVVYRPEDAPQFHEYNWLAEKLDEVKEGL